MSFTFNPAVRNAILQAALEGAEEVMHDVLVRSLAVVPVDTRPTRNNIILKDTAKVTTVGNDVFASYDTEYAILQHENQDFFHPPPTQSKFLQVPFAETPIDNVLKTIGNRIDRL